MNMGAVTPSNTPHPESSPPRGKSNRLGSVAACARSWLVERLDPSPKPTRVKLTIIAAAIFLAALGVRFLHWQDSRIEIVGGKASLSGVFDRYRKEARRMIDEGGILFPREPPEAGNARMLAHPPGYSILMAGIYAVSEDPIRPLWFVQIVCGGAAAVLVFLLAAELLGAWPAVISGMLVALSPHLAYYSLLLSPDSLAVTPVLLAIYLTVRARKRTRVINLILAGALIGVSCWLTANAMLLAPFLAVVVFFTFERGKRLMLSAALAISAVAVIAPITIRNAIVFHRFIPLSIQAGLSLVEGIGDYDKDGHLGMPRSDREARRKDAEWSGRPDYSASLWNPDGIDRDHTRLRRGLAAVRSNPGWFTGVLLHRAAAMLSYNELRSREWPEGTASAPPVAAQARYGHALEVTDEAELVWSGYPAVLVLNGTIMPGSLAVGGARESVISISPAELLASGTVFSRQATASLANGDQALQIAGDNSEYGDQLASAPIAVRKDTDYVLVLPVRLVNADMAVKVTSSGRRTTLAITSVAEAQEQAMPAADSSVGQKIAAIQLPFASGDRTEVCLVISNNAAAATPPAALLGKADILEMGATPYAWTRYPRAIVRTVQRNYTTFCVRSLVLLGIGLLLMARRFRTVIMLLAVPAYYVAVQAPLHTEYRYVLAIHYFLFVMAGVTLCCFAAAVGQAFLWTSRRLINLGR